MNLALIHYSDVTLTICVFNYNYLACLFADDTAVFFHGDDPETITAGANNEMKSIAQWYNANELKLSLNKSNFIICHGIRKK